MNESVWADEPEFLPDPGMNVVDEAHIAQNGLWAVLRDILGATKVKVLFEEGADPGDELDKLLSMDVSSIKEKILKALVRTQKPDRGESLVPRIRIRDLSAVPLDKVLNEIDRMNREVRSDLAQIEETLGRWKISLEDIRHSDPERWFYNALVWEDSLDVRRACWNDKTYGLGELIYSKEIADRAHKALQEFTGEDLMVSSTEPEWFEPETEYLPEPQSYRKAYDARFVARQIRAIREGTDTVAVEDAKVQLERLGFVTLPDPIHVRMEKVIASELSDKDKAEAIVKIINRLTYDQAVGLIKAGETDDFSISAPVSKRRWMQLVWLAMKHIADLDLLFMVKAGYLSRIVGEVQKRRQIFFHKVKNLEKGDPRYKHMLLNQKQYNSFVGAKAALMKLESDDPGNAQEVIDELNVELGE